MLGAALARGGLKPGSTVGRRVPMAIWCGLAGMAYGVILNFGSAVNLASSDIETSFWVQMVGSLPFDIAHSIANFVFFMIAGPLLIRMLERLRRREALVWPEPASAGSRASTPA